MQFTINGEQHSPAGVKEAERLLTSCRQSENLEIWVFEGSGTSLCALLNARCGWLMFQRFEDDAGFSSRNRLREQSESSDETFVLANGQVDNYPRSWTLNREIIFDTLLEFVASGQRSSKVDWHDDS